MPLYDYECGRCHHIFELRQSFHDDPIASCPRCQSDARRLIRAVPVIFKGSGWYVTDHGRAARGSSGESDGQKEPAPAPEAKDSAKEPATQPAKQESTSSPSTATSSKE
ncbi:MAG: zinc ribbon domain-containing protein [Dehalococcoidia bacterium]|nr:zinc ribbon domain-containing protein [Dehalococcoidia bacterium]